MKDFFSRPLEFSFKDLLALGFSGTFLFFCWRALENESALAVCPGCQQNAMQM